MITDSTLGRGYWLIESGWVLTNPGDVTQVGLRAKAELEKQLSGHPPDPQH